MATKMICVLAPVWFVPTRRGVATDFSAEGGGGRERAQAHQTYPQNGLLGGDVPAYTSGALQRNRETAASAAA